MRLLIRARNREVAVDGDRIVEADGAFDLILAFPDADVAPGLINAHDHLHRNHYGRLGRPPYPNAYAWAADIQACEAERIGEGRARPRRGDPARQRSLEEPLLRGHHSGAPRSVGGRFRRRFPAEGRQGPERLETPSG